MERRRDAEGRRFLGPREPANGLTHLLGAVLAVAGTVALLRAADGEPWRTVAFAIYGASMIVLYCASTLLHSLRVDARTLRRLRIFDHSAIFGLIAGTYTPITLVTLREEHAAWGWVLLVVAWSFAFLGTLFKVVWLGAPRWLSTSLYLLMGWLAAVAIVPLSEALPPSGLGWMAAGGAFYSVGAVVYGLKRPDPFPRWFGYHALWHLFVLAGSACHFVMMLLHVAPH